MATEKSNSPVIQWLLDSDPSIRWQVMRYLTDAPVDEVAAERAKLFREDRPFRRMSRRWVEQPQQNSLNVNVREDEDAYILSALVPGLQAEDLNIQVLENVVSIEGEYRAEETEFLLKELPNGSFRRTLKLPTEIEAEKVEAKIVDGVLTLSLPKAESARPKKIKIAVN